MNYAVHKAKDLTMFNWVTGEGFTHISNIAMQMRLGMKSYWAITIYVFDKTNNVDIELDFLYNRSATYREANGIVSTVLSDYIANETNLNHLDISGESWKAGAMLRVIQDPEARLLARKHGIEFHKKMFLNEEEKGIIDLNYFPTDSTMEPLNTIPEYVEHEI